MAKILFLEDWDKYPGLVVDDIYPNKHFQNYASLLKQMGVKNHAWPLVLMDKELKGRDPFKDTSRELIERFTREYKRNPWAYFRTAARAPGDSILHPQYFVANRGNMATYWSYFNHVTVISIQPRQTGKTFGMSSLDANILNVLGYMSKILMLTKDDTLRTKTLREIRELEDILPFFLKQRDKMDISNQEQIKYRSNKNEYQAVLARTDPKAADRIGRGLTVENIRADEFAYLSNIGITLPVLLGITTRARPRAVELNNPYGNIFATTSGKKDDRDGGYAYNYLQNSAIWSEFLMDAKNNEQLVEMIRTSTRTGIVEGNTPKSIRLNLTFSHRQLGYTDKWLMDTMVENSAYGEIADRDYFNIWTSGSQTSPLSTELNNKIRESLKDPAHLTVSEHGSLVTRWYIPESEREAVMAHDYHVISMDTSTGAGRDDIGMTIVSVETGEVVAASTVNEINLITVANWIYEFLTKYSKTVLVIERRDQAITILDYLFILLHNAGIDPVTRIYNKAVQEADEYPQRLAELSKPMHMRGDMEFYSRHKALFGFATSGSGAYSRNTLYGHVLQSAAINTGHAVNDKVIIDQITGLIVKNGRIDHANGAHDDMVVSWLLAFWFLSHGRNLSSYGIRPNSVLSKNSYRLSTEGVKEEKVLLDNKKDLARLDYLKDLSVNSRDSILLNKLVSEMEILKARINSNESAARTADELINNVKERAYGSMATHRSIF